MLKLYRFFFLFSAYVGGAVVLWVSVRTFLQALFIGSLFLSLFENIELICFTLLPPFLFFVFLYQAHESREEGRLYLPLLWCALACILTALVYLYGPQSYELVVG